MSLAVTQLWRHVAHHLIHPRCLTHRALYLDHYHPFIQSFSLLTAFAQLRVPKRYVQLMSLPPNMGLDARLAGNESRFFVKQEN